MPTKATKKNKTGEKNKGSEKNKGDKNKGQQQQALVASYVAWGPPFMGYGPYPPAMWGRYPPVDGRTTPCPGFWGYVKMFPSTGGMVTQLGAETGTGAATCVFYTYYEYVFTAKLTGEHIFALTLNLGPVSRRPRYGRVQILGVLQIMGPGGHWADFNEDLPSNIGITLVVRPIITAGGLYRLRFGVAPVVENAGQQSYGEAIVNSAVLTEFLPYGVQAAQTVRPKAAAAVATATTTENILNTLLNADGEQAAESISLSEGAQAGVGYSL